MPPSQSGLLSATDMDCDSPSAPIDFFPQLLLLSRSEGREHFVGQFAIDLLGLVDVFRVDGPQSSHLLRSQPQPNGKQGSRSRCSFVWTLYTGPAHTKCFFQ